MQWIVQSFKWNDIYLFVFMYSRCNTTHFRSVNVLSRGSTAYRILISMHFTSVFPTPPRGGSCLHCVTSFHVAAWLEVLSPRRPVWRSVSRRSGGTEWRVDVTRAKSLLLEKGVQETNFQASPRLAAQRVFVPSTQRADSPHKMLISPTNFRHVKKIQLRVTWCENLWLFCTLKCSFRSFRRSIAIQMHMGGISILCAKTTF